MKPLVGLYSFHRVTLWAVKVYRAISISGTISVNGLFFEANLAIGISITNDDASLLFSGGINSGPGTDGGLPRIKSGFAIGLHDKMGTNNDVLSGIGGKSGGYFGGFGFGGSYTESLLTNGQSDQNGVSNIGINLGPIYGGGRTQSSGFSWKASDFINYLKD